MYWSVFSTCPLPTNRPCGQVACRCTPHSCRSFGSVWFKVRSSLVSSPTSASRSVPRPISVSGSTLVPCQVPLCLLRHAEGMAYTEDAEGNEDGQHGVTHNFWPTTGRHGGATDCDTMGPQGRQGGGAGRHKALQAIHKRGSAPATLLQHWDSACRSTHKVGYTIRQDRVCMHLPPEPRQPVPRPPQSTRCPHTEAGGLPRPWRKTAHPNRAKARTSPGQSRPKSCANGLKTLLRHHR